MRTTLFAAAAAALLAACGPAAGTREPDAALTKAAVEDGAKIAAVMVFAEWCSSCKVMDPKIAAVRARGEVEGVDHIVLDFTERDPADFFAQAEAAGVGPAIREEFSDEILTGVVILVDVDDQKAVADLRKELTEDEIADIIQWKLAEA
ncbi:MAG: hypothetical protein AAFX03_00330 [Pseudomonadota bacterium]